MTRNTNDLTLAFARARRDLGCHYTLGTYDRRPGVHYERNLVVEVRRPGLRVLHTSAYSFRSPEDRRVSRLTAAWMVPEMFPGGVVRAHLFPLRPGTRKVWDALLAVEFPTAMLGDRKLTETFTLGGMVRAGSRIAYGFNREVRLRAKDGGPWSDRQVAFLQNVSLEPGVYDLTLVAEGSGGEKIFTAKVQVDLPEMPRDTPFLVGPFLGRRAGPDVVVQGGVHRKGNKGSVDDPSTDRVGTSASFAPILVGEVAQQDAIAAWTLGCVVSPRRAPTVLTLERGLVDAGGADAGTLPPVDLALDSGGAVRCEQALDIVPVGSLLPGSYRFAARLHAGPAAAAAAAIPFAVVEPAPEDESATAEERP